MSSIVSGTEDIMGKQNKMKQKSLHFFFSLDRSFTLSFATWHLELVLLTLYWLFL